jgi:hypothetical protein
MGREEGRKKSGWVPCMTSAMGYASSFRARIPRFCPPWIWPFRERRTRRPQHRRRRGEEGRCKETRGGVSLLLDGGTCPCKLTSTAIATILAHGPPFWTSAPRPPPPFFLFFPYPSLSLVASCCAAPEQMGHGQGVVARVDGARKAKQRGHSAPEEAGQAGGRALG